VSLASGLAAGVLVNHWLGREPLQAYAAALVGASLSSFVSSWFLSHVPEPAMAPVSDVVPRLTTMLSKPLRDHGFRQLILFLASWSFSSNLAAPFIKVYLLDHLVLSLGAVVSLWACSQVANALTVGPGAARRIVCRTRPCCSLPHPPCWPASWPCRSRAHWDPRPCC
jgi:hypothetical protein